MLSTAAFQRKEAKIGYNCLLQSVKTFEVKALAMMNHFREHPEAKTVTLLFIALTLTQKREEMAWYQT